MNIENVQEFIQLLDFSKIVNVHKTMHFFNFVMKNCDHVSVNNITCSI